MRFVVRYQSGEQVVTSSPLQFLAALADLSQPGFRSVFYVASASADAAGSGPTPSDPAETQVVPR